VASLFTNVFFQPPYVREKKVVMWFVAEIIILFLIVVWDPRTWNGGWVVDSQAHT
jgi:hypothetical protein